MKILDYNDTFSPARVTSNKHFTEIAAAALIFLFPTLVLFVLSL